MYFIIIPVSKEDYENYSMLAIWIKFYHLNHIYYLRITTTDNCKRVIVLMLIPKMMLVCTETNQWTQFSPIKMVLSYVNTEYIF